MKYDYIVVGAGLAGCVFAYMASINGYEVLVIDKRDHIGGNCHIENVNGIHVHKYGAHIFKTNDKEVYEFVSKFVSLNNFINTPIAICGREAYNLPFNMNTFSKMFGVINPEDAIREINKSRVVNNNPKNLEEHCLNTVGKEIYEKLVKGYTEKQWGMKCTELSPYVMKRIQLRFTYDNNYYDALYQGVADYDIMFNKMLMNCTVILNTKYEDSMKNIANRIVYTGALDELYKYEYGVLDYRGLYFEHERIGKKNVQGVAVMNYTDIDVPYTRTIEHKHFMKDKTDFTIVTKEYPIKWEKGKERYYPVNDRQNNLLHLKYKERAYKDNILLCGRLAEYKYYDMQDTIKSAINLYKSIDKQ